MSDISINSGYSQGSLYTSSSDLDSSNTSASSPSSASAPSATGDLLRLNGMASGLDVDKIVSQMMTPYQMQIDRVKQSIQTVQWRQQAYLKIINDIKEFQSTYLNSAKPDMNIISGSFFNAMIASSSSTDVAVSANSDAEAGNYRVRIENLADKAAISGSSLSSQVAFSSADQWFGHNITFQAGDTVKEISLDPAADGSGIADVVNDINKIIAGDPDLGGKVTASYVGGSIRFTNTGGLSVKITESDISDLEPMIDKNIVSLGSNTKLSDLGFTGGGELGFKYNNTGFAVGVSSQDETLGQLANDISKATSGQVTARIDNVSGEFVIGTSNTGSGNTLSITEGSDAALIGALGLMVTDPDHPAQGVDAKLVINDTTAIAESSNSFVLNGVNINLNNSGDTDINITVSSNTDDVFDKFETFMDKYNGIVAEIKGKLDEKVSFDYPPLTDAQKKQMSDSDITAWNEKAQVGILHGDDDLEKLLDDLRSTFYGTDVSSGVSFGRSIGLDFSNDISEAGKLVFTDGTGDKFKQALKSNGYDITKLFSKAADPGLTGEDRYNSEGIFQKINDIITDNTGLTGVTSSDSVLGKMALKQDDFSALGGGGTNTFLDQIYRYNLKIKSLQDTFSMKQTEYYNEFTSLETALNTLNTQSAMLSQLTGGSD